ncbi:hypothetical protein Emin_1200 [Elusimicrobium minutum Pei191]|uniref:Thioredoxin-like fold domain-containing protein n=1 Tax=Elusimicrobium minutum (strain Pei191) TaxID=445932 RepID=B2KE04_ELUMP|nr:hypothetical protein [Elusimicrobium minutum]ACC98750.1 hypothetical protein Emin_1200 [Elusimicrobium minutum Pei191]
MKKIALLLAVILVFGACAKNNVKENAAAQPQTQEAEVQPFDMIVIQTSVEKAGMQDLALTQGLQAFAGAPANVTVVDYAIAKESLDYAGLDFDFLPLYLVKKTPETEKVFKQHIDAGYIKTHGDYIVFEKQTRQGVFINRPLQKNLLEVFVMSQCPYGAMAENKIIEAKNAGKFPKDIKVKLRYIVTDMGDGNFRSLHGTAEWEENVRQLIIHAKYPSKFWKYLEIRNKDYTSSRWDEALKKAGIPVTSIDANWKMGVELLKKDAKYAQEVGVSGSPTFLWEGRTLLDFGGIAEIKGLEFMNPQIASAGAAAVPQGGSCQ